VRMEMAVLVSGLAALVLASRTSAP
jgi:hypothetical protein